MWKVLQRLNVLAICLLGAVLAAVLVAQIWPRVRALAQADPRDDEWTGQSTWPRTLQVYPAHEGDPVKLVKITKAGQELVPGKYELPQIAGDTSQNVDAAKDWLSERLLYLEEPNAQKHCLGRGCFRIARASHRPRVLLWRQVGTQRLVRGAPPLVRRRVPHPCPDYLALGPGPCRDSLGSGGPLSRRSYGEVRGQGSPSRQGLSTTRCRPGNRAFAGWPRRRDDGRHGSEEWLFSHPGWDPLRRRHRGGERRGALLQSARIEEGVRLCQRLEVQHRDKHRLF